MKEAEKYGAMCKMGYFPDAFGNAGQMPQLLKQAGMDTVTSDEVYVLSGLITKFKKMETMNLRIQK